MSSTGTDLEFSVGLFDRHDMVTNDGVKIVNFVFPKQVENIDFDFLERRCREYIQGYMDIMKEVPDKRSTFNLYVTGHGPSVVSFLKCWVEQQERLEMCYGDLVLQHWNRETQKYDSQPWAVITWATCKHLIESRVMDSSLWTGRPMT